MASAADTSGSNEAYRVALRTSTAAIIKEVGFTDTEPAALDVMAEMVQSLIGQLGQSSKQYSELANRCSVMVSDVSLALVDAGISLDSISSFAEQKLSKVSYVRPPQKATEPPKPKTLQVAHAPTPPNYVHENLPSFPDKHTYIATAAKRLPTTDYQLVREKAASQKRDVETALTKFIAKATKAELTQYCEEDNPLNVSFPLIICTPSPLSYLSALLAKDSNNIEEFDLKQEQNLPQALEHVTKAKKLKFSDQSDYSKPASDQIEQKQEESSPPLPKEEETIDI